MSQASAVSPVNEGDLLAAKYRVEKVLGVGGMGVVVAAMHVELEQRVALKFLLPAATESKELLGRFLREARASVRLRGEHVAKVLDVGRLEDGCPYIVMEYLDGRDLGAELKAVGGPLSIEDAATYLLHACEGLAEAHAAGIVHRDLKPGNLFLTRGPDGRPLVKVLDFGISKNIDPTAVTDGLSLTKTEMLLGSPLYMAPEQMRSSKSADAKADLWALGAIGFELLTGRVPFQAESLLELCFKIAQENAPDLHALRPEAPAAFAGAVMRCLEKEPARRWRHVGELALAIEPFANPRERGAADRALDMLRISRPEVQALREAAEASVSPTVPATPAPTPKPDATPSPLAAASPTPVPEPIAPEPTAPPASAWGATQAQRKVQAGGRRALVFGAGGAAIAAVALVISFTLSKNAPTEPESPRTSSATRAPEAVPSPAVPSPSLTVVKQDEPPPPPPPPPPSAAEPTTESAPREMVKRPPAIASGTGRRTPTAPSAKASASAAPVDPGGFIKVRE